MNYKLVLKGFLSDFKALRAGVVFHSSEPGYVATQGQGIA